jgi:hypothetical protein
LWKKRAGRGSITNKSQRKIRKNYQATDRFAVEKDSRLKVTNHESKRGGNLEKVFLLFALLMTSAIPSGLWAQQAGYSETNLVSNTAGVAKTTDLNY